MASEVMSTGSATNQPRSSDAIRVDRVVLGVLIGGIGVAWLLDQAGVSVPWHLVPATALCFVGLALLATLFGGRGRGGLITLGIIAAVVALSVGLGVDRYAGPVGDQLLAPTVAQWPVHAEVSAGTVTVDLTRHPLPESGTLQVDVGAGRIVLALPESARVGVDATVTAGTVTVDGVKVGDGIDVRWAPTPTSVTPVDIELHVGLGDIEVNHE